MTFVQWPVEQQLRSVFRRKARRGYVRNIVFDPEIATAATLEPGETVVLRIDGDAAAYLLTSARVLKARAEGWEDYVRWTEVVEFDWIAADREQAIRERSQHFGRLLLYTAGGDTVVMDGLGQSVFPLHTFLRRWTRRGGGR